MNKEANNAVTRRGFVGGAAVAGLGATLALQSSVAKAEEAQGEYLWTATEPEGWDEECEMLIIGCGAAGACALIEANELGLKAIALEKNYDIKDCNCARSGGAVCAVNTIFQQQQGIEDNVDLFVNDVNVDGGWFGDQDVIRAWGEISGETLEWMYDMDVPFNPETYDAFAQTMSTAHSVARDYKCLENPSTGYGWMQGLEAVILDRGYDLRLNTAGSKLYRDSTGRVVGAEAMGSDGDTYNIKATKGVLVCTGGLGSNKEYRSKYSSYYKWVIENCPNVFFRGPLSCDADGTKMLESVGAKMNTVRPDVTIGPVVDQANVVGTIAPYPSYWRWDPHPLLVNYGGKRFMNECSFADLMENRTIFYQDRITAFCIFDEAIRDTVNCQNYGQWYLDHSAEIGYPEAAGSFDTLEELADFFDIDREGLLATVEDFNSRVDSQEPDEFGRTIFTSKIENPPYYGFLNGVNMSTTKGGAAINAKGQVLDYFGNPIPGLYAAGEDAMFSAHGSAEIHIVGGCNSFAFNYGRICARSIAEEA